MIGSLHAAGDTERPLQVVGVPNAYCALLAREAGFRALYLSGAGVANSAFGIPDLGLTALGDVVEETRRITRAVPLPLLVDADTGFGDPARAVRELQIAGAAGLHIEDQIERKRCGHLPGKQLVPAGEMVARIEAAVAAREGDFVIMARTDACSVEGLDAAVERALRYRDAGADMIFAEAFSSLDDYRRLVEKVQLPVLANLTEFGRTPFFKLDDLRAAGVALVLYPLSAFRAMSAAARHVYKTIRHDGTQQTVVPAMQTREELYRTLDYDAWVKRLDDEGK